MIDINVFGADYGETIIISFGEGTTRQHGVVDCHVNVKENNPIVKFLRERLGAGSLAFIIATHPHEDHIAGLAHLLNAYADKVAFFGWWGGMDPDFQVSYFKQLQQYYIARRVRSAVRVNHIHDLFASVRHDQKHLNGWRTSTDALAGGDAFFYRSDIEPNFVIRAVGPWLVEKAAFNKQLLSAVTRRGISVNGSLAEGNQTSLGLLIEYGKARILLGGDMEKENWRWVFRYHPEMFEGGMHFVKVPHHASKTGVHRDMWTGRKYFVATQPGHTVAVATRFNRGKQLPDGKVLDKIRKAGCKTCVVAGEQGQGIASNRIGGVIQSTALCRFHAAIALDGTVKVSKMDYSFGEV